MRIVEFNCEHPILHETLQRIPDLELEWVQSDIQESDRIRTLLWATTDDYSAFEDALEDDPTTTAPIRSVDLGDRRLYQLEFIGEGPRTSIYPTLVEEGCIIQSLRGTSDGWEFRVAFPSNEAITRVFSFFSDGGIPFTVHRTFEERSELDFGLTEPQRDTIQKAFDSGYFDVPRGTSLDDLATDLGVSDTAVSQRLRRGMKTIIERTINNNYEWVTREQAFDGEQRTR